MLRKDTSIGLSLWYENMLPTLLPFSILSYILIHSGILDQSARWIHKFLKHVFPISSAGIYPLAFVEYKAADEYRTDVIADAKQPLSFFLAHFFGLYQIRRNFTSHGKTEQQPGNQWVNFGNREESGKSPQNKQILFLVLIVHKLS